MRIGFTGTQKGMTDAQKTTVERLVTVSSAESFNMGDCIGADEDFYDIVKKCKPTILTVGHVPNNISKRAFCKYDFERVPLPYLQRNQEICHESQLLIATPDDYKEELRSGTWATIRYARKKNVKIIIVWPNGSITVEKKSWQPPDKNVDGC
jgi:hypothetical protein